MSYRPKVKTTESGVLVDLPLDADTLNGEKKADIIKGLQPTSSAINTSNIGSQSVKNAGAVRDAGTGQEITLKYSSGGNATPQYFAVWNGYQITYASYEQVKAHLGISTGGGSIRQYKYNNYDVLSSGQIFKVKMGKKATIIYCNGVGKDWNYDNFPAIVCTFTQSASGDYMTVDYYHGISVDPRVNGDQIYIKATKNNINNGEVYVSQIVCID